MPSYSTGSQQQRKHEPWRNQERHYCAVCNVWMGSDRQSILLHENGKKHQQMVEQALQEKRQTKIKEEKYQHKLESSLLQMEQAAAAAMGISVSIAKQPTIVEPPAPAVREPPKSPEKHKKKQEKKDWSYRRDKRKQDAARGDAEDDEDENGSQKQSKKARLQIQPGEGVYTHEGIGTYLEGQIYYGLFEEDLPVQIWTGPILASATEKRLIDRAANWKDALVVAVKQPTKSSKNQDNMQPCVVHISYLDHPDDTEETLLRNVALDRLRLVAGSDDRIPNDLEEARLLAMGGEEIQAADNDMSLERDEATGLSGWSTVTIQRTTVQQEIKEERARLREKRREAAMAQDEQQKQLIARRMEETKVANADDSALGAYDVWGKGDYKGIDIQKEDNVKVEETAKSLASGKSNVAFKKKKKKAMSAARRTTSSED